MGRLAGRIWSRAALLACCLPGLALAELNDTGIVRFGDKTSYELASEPADHPGQDARFGRDAAAMAGKLAKKGGGAKGFDFTKLDAEGQPMPADAKNWACVRDNVAGLVWEVKTADGGLRDWNNHYTWYNPDPAANGGAPGAETGVDCKGDIKCNTHAYTQAVNAIRLCGFSDWRLPERRELRSLVDYSKAGSHRPTIDEDFFPNTQAKWHWSSSPYAIAPNYAWGVSFYDGGDGNNIMSRQEDRLTHVRLVRGTAAKTRD
jgi:hypothetical protein